MKITQTFKISLLCLTGIIASFNTYGAPPATADYYYIFLNTSTVNNQLISIISLGEHTSNHGEFSIVSSRLYYKTKPNQTTAGVDSCTVNTTGGTKKVAVIVCAIRRAAVDFEQDDGDDNIFDANNALMPIADLPENWDFHNDFYTYDGMNRIANPPGVSLTQRYTGSVYALPRLYVNSQLQASLQGEIQLGIGPVGIIKSIPASNRHYVIVDKKDRGFGSNEKIIHTTSGSNKIYLIDNYSNSENYGKFILSNNDQVLSYRSDPDKGYGMDMQAFAVASASGPVPTEATRLAYGVNVEPIDKPVAENGWAILEARDIIKGMPRNYFVKYTYFRPTSNPNDLIPGTRIDNLEGSDLRAVVNNIPLSNQFGGIPPGAPWHPGGATTCPTQTYILQVELYQSMGPTTKTKRVTSDPLPIYCWKESFPDWFTEENYNNELIEITFECPTFSVCPESDASNMSSYEVALDIEVRTIAYKLKEGDDGVKYRDLEVTPVDLTNFAEYTGYYDRNGNQLMSSSTPDNIYPYHRYQVAAEWSYGFPHSGTNGTVFTTGKSYGTRIDDNSMALYIKTTIDPKDLWGSSASATPIVIPASEGEIIIERGICGSLTEAINCPDANSLLYRQDFNGYDTTDPLFYDSTKVEFSRKSYINAKEAIKGSTYSYKSFEREKTSSTTYPNDGLPYLEEGEFMLTKKTEQHLNTNISSSPMWTRFHSDHTFPNNVDLGYMMQVNAGVEKGTFFDYEIFSLCKGATMTFTAWIKNTVRNNSSNPADQIFEIYDGANGKLLSRYVTGPILNPANASSSPNINDWKQYGFKFTLPPTTDHIRLKILNNGRGSDGNDFAIDDIEVRLCNFTETRAIEVGDPEPCVEKEITVEVTLANNDKKYYAWLYSPTGQINVGDPWLQLATGEIRETDPFEDEITLTLNPYAISVDKTEYPAYPTGYFRLAIGYSPDFLNGNCYVITDPVAYMSTTIGDAYLWTGAVDGTWQNSANWKRFYPDGSHEPEDTQGESDYPNDCNDVYIPGKDITYYPIIVNGDACRNIHFYYGGQIQNAELLKYTRAFVDYNFGQVDALSPAISSNKTQMQLNYSAPPLYRAQWHMIAAPLKNIAVGDFGFAGKPHTWQMKFKSLKDGDNDISYGEWSGNFNDADIELETNHNAMAVLVGGYVDNYTGLDNHDNIESIDGVIQLPYFFDTQSPQHKSHPLHEYDSYTLLSTFYRYNMSTLETIYDDPWIVVRAEEYGPRFVFEDSQHTPRTPYTYEVPAGQDVLIGNPFPSQLDMDQFIEDNENMLTSPVYYDFVGDYESEENQTFTYYVKGNGTVPGLNIPQTASRYVAPLKSFVISTSEENAVGGKVTLALNYDQAVVKQTREDFIPPSPAPSPARERSSSQESTPEMLLLSLEGELGNSVLTLSFEDKKSGNAGLLRMKDSKVPSIYAIDPQNGQSNMVQFEGGYKRCVIPLGILAFNDNEQLTIKTFNANNLNVENIFLVDTKLNEEIDLLTTDSYTFNHINGINKRFELHLTPKITTDREEDDPSKIWISYENSNIRISSTKEDPIESVEIFDLMGRAVIKEFNINGTLVDYQPGEENKVLIVKVKTHNSGPVIQKIVLD